MNTYFSVWWVIRQLWSASPQISSIDKLRRVHLLQFQDCERCCFSSPCSSVSVSPSQRSVHWPPVCFLNDPLKWKSGRRQPTMSWVFWNFLWLFVIHSVSAEGECAVVFTFSNWSSERSALTLSGLLVRCFEAQSMWRSMINVTQHSFDDNDVLQSSSTLEMLIRSWFVSGAQTPCSRRWRRGTWSASALRSAAITRRPEKSSKMLKRRSVVCVIQIRVVFRVKMAKNEIFQCSGL